MKTSHKYILSSLITGVVVAGLSIGTLGFAQTVSPVTCSVGSASVTPNQSVILTAGGGTGTYSFSGTNVNTANSSSTQTTVSFPNPGTYPVVVTSGAQTATCNVVVVAAPSSGTLMCAPATQTVTLGQTASVTATGGDGVNYTWSSPSLTISNPSGSGFSANFASVGVQTLTVSSAGNSASCAVNVVAPSTVTTPVVTTPSLPDTGGGYGK